MSLIKGEVLVFPQRNDSDVSLIVNGDEFYARYTTLDGYTTVYDEQLGLFCYAQVHQGTFTSSRRPIRKQPLENMQRQLHEAAEVQQEKHNVRLTQIRPIENDLTFQTFGPKQGLLTGRQVNTGNVRGLTILVEFKDETTQITGDQVDAMLNDLNFSAHGNFCSVRRYYQLMSSNKLDYTNDVIGPIKLSKNKSFYVNNLLVQEALNLAIMDHGVDLSNYDSRGDGIVDALSFMYAGRTEYRNWLWPHNSVIHLQQDNTRTHFYTIQSLGRRAVDLSIGTFAHESGHMLCRFPDLYDYGSRDGDNRNSSGLGRYCMMSSGNHLGRGKVPAPICAYLRYLTGWIDTEIDLASPGEYQISHGEYNKAYIYHTEHDNEFFLVENRQNLDLDRHLPSKGLAVYHCDRNGSNEWQDGTESRHYQCALLQADGRRDLERNEDAGDADDLYDTNMDGEFLSAKTNPSTLQWDGTESGLVISDIQLLAREIKIRTGAQIIPTGETVMFKHKSNPDLLIPDNNKAGIIDAITVPKRGKLISVQLSINISHTYRGDLEVELKSPAGTSVMLHSGQGGQLDNLNLLLNSNDSNSPLAVFKQEAVQGQWQLTVRDLLADDQGRLDDWTLEIAYKPTEQTIKVENKPNLAIPDNSRVGIQDVISIDAQGEIAGVSVAVDINHSYRGDLMIQLVAPSGEIVVLKNVESDARSNVKFIYTPESTPTLNNLIGSEIKGDWILQVRDLWSEDQGILNTWSLEIKYE
ncbi:M6 family metalloprotease domain-containing protein [Thalassotalea montiporae]